MSELKSFKYTTKHFNIPYELEVYLKSEADEVISTIKAERDEYRYNLSCARNEIHNMQVSVREDVKRIADKDKVIAELKQKLEDVQASAYAESVDAGMRERRLKRALWLARAKRATEKADSFIDIKVTYNGVCNIDHSVYPQNNARRMLTCDEWLDVWTNVWEKCLKKAEQYK